MIKGVRCRTLLDTVILFDDCLWSMKEVFVLLIFVSHSLSLKVFETLNKGIDFAFGSIWAVIVFLVKRIVQISNLMILGV